MAESNVFQDREVTDSAVQKRDIFLRFHYTDMRDAFKQLFTANAAVFAFSATLGQKAREIEGLGWQWKVYYFSPYALFILSLIVCAIGHYLLGVAGDKATNVKLWGYRLKIYDSMPFEKCAVRAGMSLEVSGLLFILGLLMLAIVAVM